MAQIKNYITQDDGTTTVVIEGAELGDKETLLLDNGYEVECDLRIEDPFKITDKQRRKIFALCNDIESHTGQPRDYMRLFVPRICNGSVWLRQEHFVK